MSGMSQNWMAVIQSGRCYDTELKSSDKAVPIVPWIHPPLHPKVQEVIKRVGTTIHLNRQEKLIRLDRRISHLALVTHGVTARNFGNPVVGTEDAAAISPPGHIAFGNLNFFSERPAFGHYFAITKAQIVVCDKKLLLPLLEADPELITLLVKHFECCTLSDRIGLAYMALAPVEERLKAFVISWAVHYGKLIEENGQYRIKIPVPLTRSARCLVANASSVSTDFFLKKWKELGVWKREDEFVTFPVSFFEDTYKWMRDAEEESAYDYAPTLLELFKILPQINCPLY